MPAFQYKRRDPSAIEKRAEQRGGGEFQGIIKPKYRTYKVKKGNNWIRFLPPTWEGADHYMLDVYVHFGVGPEKATVLCPISHKKGKCPVCEARLKAERAGDEEAVKEMRVSKRCVGWILDRAKKEDENVPQIYVAPWTLDRDISSASKDRMTGTHYFIDDPVEGYDVAFDKTGEGMLTKYIGVQPARQASSVSENVLEFITKHPVPETLWWRDYDEIRVLFEGLGAQDEQASREPPRQAPRQESRAAPPVDDELPPWDRAHPDEAAGKPAERRQPDPAMDAAPRAEGRPAPRQAPPEPKEEAASPKSRAEALRAAFAATRQQASG